MVGFSQGSEAAKSNGLKNPLTKAGEKKLELQWKIADYYDLDLSVNAVVSLKNARPAQEGDPKETVGSYASVEC